MMLILLLGAWYCYDGQINHWANAKTDDGSMWVWIPRFAYKITSGEYTYNMGTIEIVFLKGTTNKDYNGNDVTSNNYIDMNGNVGAYTVHPAFQNGTRNNFANGEWDNEIPGFWIAKFEAGYVGTAGESTTAIDSNINYSTIMSYTGSGSTNYQYNYYGERSTETKIKYPVFKANRPSMNYIGVSDAYDLCMDIKNATNVYGLSNVDSHLTKNSEWGAVAYLTHSKYGRNGQEMTINNVTANNTNTINAVTGYGASTLNADAETRTLSELLTEEQTGSWTTDEGKNASSTGNIYGIYDLKGGLNEYTAGHIATTGGNYVLYGGSLKEENSTKYKSKYEGDSSTNTENYNNTINTARKGEAIWETSSSGTSNCSWGGKHSYFSDYSRPFLARGGCWNNTNKAGIFAFYYFNGYCRYNIGFRAVLIAK